jgi:hypothetical protein
MASHSPHRHGENPWRVRVNGKSKGAGVLLDQQNVLTAAHVVGDEHQTVEIESTVCEPEWRAIARVRPGSWVHNALDTKRRDVALLQLADPAPCDGYARLWRVPLSGGKVRSWGFPEAEPGGIPCTAELGGEGGRGDELGLLNWLPGNAQWIERGFSGAGVIMLDGDHAGHVIGIIVAKYRSNEGDRGGWIMPTETISRHLPDIDGFVAGEPTTTLPRPSGGRRLVPVSLGPVQDALIRELRELLLSKEWAGTVVLPDSADTGTEWLSRLVSTADPATRAAAYEPKLAGADRYAALPLGAIDAACDARGKRTSEIRRYLALRFGMAGDDHDLVPRLLRRKPPACIIIDGVDRGDPELIPEMVRPLAAEAWLRGLRLVLGFDGKVPRGFPCEVSLDARPITGGSGGGVSVTDAAEHVRQLEAAEAVAARIDSEKGFRFPKPPRLPAAHAPRLRVRLAIASSREPSRAGPDPEVAAIDEAAVTARGKVELFLLEWERLERDLRGLRSEFAPYLAYANRRWKAENQPFSDLRDEANKALRQAPFDIANARELVRRYKAKINGDINGDEEEDRG